MTQKPLRTSENSTILEAQINGINVFQQKVIDSLPEEAKATAIKMFVCFNRAAGKISLDDARKQAIQIAYGNDWEKSKPRKSILDNYGITLPESSYAIGGGISN